MCGVGEHARMARQRRRRHLVGRAADVERAAAEVAGVERGEQGGVVDQLAARGVDEEGAAASSPRTRRRPSASRSRRWPARGRRRSRTRRAARAAATWRSARVAPSIGCGVVDQRRACRGRARGRRGAADLAEADHAQGRAAQLAAHARRRRLAAWYGLGVAADAAAEVDHHADDPLGHRRRRSRRSPASPARRARSPRRRRRCGCRPRSG